MTEQTDKRVLHGPEPERIELLYGRFDRSGDVKWSIWSTMFVVTVSNFRVIVAHSPRRCGRRGDTKLFLIVILPEIRSNRGHCPESATSRKVGRTGLHGERHGRHGGERVDLERVGRVVCFPFNLDFDVLQASRLQSLISCVNCLPRNTC